MKVALVTRRYPPLIGGAERVLSYLAPALQAQGADVTVVTSAAPELSAVGGQRSAVESSVPVVRLPTSSLRFVGTSIYMRSLRRWLLNDRPDLIYVSMLKHDAYVAVGVGRELGVPVVLRPEGAGATGDLAWQKWGRFGGRIGRRCKQADAFVAISAAVHRELIDAGYDRAKIHDIPNGVPVPAMMGAGSTSGARGPCQVAFVGRLAPEKNLDALISAWPIVERAFPGSLLKLIGDGPERSRLESLAARVAPQSVRFLGAQSDPPTILRSCDLFVLPSKEEGMSIALLEAMALGIPIVASDIPGNRRLITDGIHGRLAPPDDPEAMGRVIVQALRDAAGSASMRLAARERVIENFSIEAMARRHLELFGVLSAEC